MATPVSFGDPPRPEISLAIRRIVGEVLSGSYTHRELVTLFLEAGAPGDVPREGNKATTCSAWFKQCSGFKDVDPFVVLGKVIGPFMDSADLEPYRDERAQKAIQDGRERIVRIMAREGLSYRCGGIVFGQSVSAPSRSLAETIRDRDLPAVTGEFDRALATVATDPPAALTAACAILESLCKIYIEDEGLAMPSDQSIKPLWGVVQKHLGLDPAAIPDSDLKPILGGMSAIVDGIGAWRTHKGSAHGRGRKAYKPEPRHARLAVHAAHTLATFVLETWDVRRNTGHAR
jgi:hypothetical protein